MLAVYGYNLIKRKRTKTMNKRLKDNKNKDKEKQQKSLSSPYDVNGSYTGTPAYNDRSAPTQDADDL